MTKRHLPKLALVLLLAAGQCASAGGPVGSDCCGPVLVPQVTYKTITVQTMACKPEVRQATVMAYRLVPETKVVDCMRLVVEHQRRTWTENYTACRWEFDVAQKQVTVMVPHRELRQGVRTVCKPVATQVMQTICNDMGQWTTQKFVDCYGCEQSCRVWAPNIVTEQVPVTVYKPTYAEEPFQYDEIVCRPEVRNVTVRTPRPVYETKTREVSCLVPICKHVPAQVPVTTYRKVVEPRVVNYTAMVTVPVTKQIQVPVCTLVPVAAAKPGAAALPVR